MVSKALCLSVNHKEAHYSFQIPLYIVSIATIIERNLKLNNGIQSFTNAQAYSMSLQYQEEKDKREA